MDKNSKDLLEIKKLAINLRQNQDNLYTICSSLYKEIHNIKQFVKYTEPDISNIPVQPQGPNIGMSDRGFNNEQKFSNMNSDSLNGLEQFANSQRTNINRGVYKKKVIDN